MLVVVVVVVDVPVRMQCLRTRCFTVVVLSERKRKRCECAWPRVFLSSLCQYASCARWLPPCVCGVDSRLVLHVWCCVPCSWPGRTKQTTEPSIPWQSDAPRKKAENRLRCKKTWRNQFRKKLKLLRSKVQSKVVRTVSSSTSDHPCKWTSTVLTPPTGHQDGPQDQPQNLPVDVDSGTL